MEQNKKDASTVTGPMSSMSPTGSPDSQAPACSGIESQFSAMSLGIPSTVNQIPLDSSTPSSEDDQQLKKHTTTPLESYCSLSESRITHTPVDASSSTDGDLATKIIPVKKKPGHHLKQISWNKKTIQIVTQNENGPCPLIAIANVLLLRGTISLPAIQSVSTEQLLQHVADVILNNYPKNLDASRVLDYERNINDAITVLPRLLTGLDVNVIFTGVKKFEYTPECIIFDLLDIPLYHGWLVDPQDQATVEAVGTLGYNQLVDRIIANKCSDRSELVTQALVAEQFLEGTASQLTYHGLCELNSALKSNELAILFRNNHFSTIFKKRASNSLGGSPNNLENLPPPQDELFQLVTDQGFLNEPRVVWETLINIEGDGLFVDSNFNTSPLKSVSNFLINPPVGVTKETQIDQDYLLALSLNEEMKVDKEVEWTEGKEAVEVNIKSPSPVTACSVESEPVEPASAESSQSSRSPSRPQSPVHHQQSSAETTKKTTCTVQ